LGGVFGVWSVPAGDPARRLYGIPTEQVIGSSVRTTSVVRDGQPMILRTELECSMMRRSALVPIER